MSFCKTIVVVDRDVRPEDTHTLIDLLLNRLDMTTDTTQTRGVLDVLDHSSPFVNFGAKLGLDLTRRFPGEPARRISPLPPLPEEPASLSAIQSHVNEVADCRHLFSDHPGNNAPVNRILAVSVAKDAHQSSGEIGKRLSAIPVISAFNLIILFDKNVNLSNGGHMLWKVFNNVDPARDIMPCGQRVIIDACKKGPADGHDRPWPEDLSF